MEKELMISIQPKHLVNILNGFKTLELRKTVPKDFKGWVYIYCTKGKDILEYSYLNFRNQKGQVFAFINDKKKHSYIEDNLDTEIFKYDNSTDILYISAKTKDTKVVRDIIETKKVPDKYRMIIVTSSASTGIEFEFRQ